jgi:membrane-bound ClpP family serine protease
MKLISFVWNKNYIYIFILTIILFISDFYNGFIIKRKNNKEYNYLIKIFNMIGQFLNIFLFYKFKKKQTENKGLKLNEKLNDKTINMNKNVNFIIKIYDIILL